MAEKLEAQRVQCPEAAAMLGVSVRTVQLRAAAGEIPGAALIFGRWTFDPVMLRRFIKQREATPCRQTSTGAEALGTRGSRSENDKYESRYRQIIGRRRKAA